MGATTGADRPRKKIQRKRLPVAPYFVALLAVTGLLWAAAVAGAGWKFPTPKLGLDLQGGLTMTLSAYNPDASGSPSAESMDQARQIIEGRVNSTGVTEPEVYVEGSENIIVNVAGDDTEEEALRDVGAPAELRFRIVTDQVEDYSQLEDIAGQEPPADPEPPAEESGEGEDNDDAADDSTGDDSAAEDTTEDEDAAGSPQVDTADGGVTLEQVWESVGEEAAGVAQGLTAAPADEATLAALEPFGELTAEEVGVLPGAVQFLVPQITCEQLDNRPPGAVQQPDAEVAACSAPEAVTEDQPEATISYKYLLQPATVLGSHVSSADVGSDPGSLNQFLVSVEFTGEGAQLWGDLTEQHVGQQVAIVLDNEVVSAPVIREASRNSTSISGDFNATEARQLADQLNFGSLPITFVVETLSEVTATLGVDQLEAGLLAMLIGLILVFLYCLAYYRVLGFVVLSSLIIATIVLYPTVALLGTQIGLTLTLAGVAGFVVAIGITADSFVVYFERIKEEMRDGRSPRTAVPRAWLRTRRTILSANAVSIISALVLYFLAVGPVRAFAFALGLSTLVNILVVFLFTHPIAEWMARGKVLSNVHLSGLHTKANPVPGKKAAARG